MAQEPIVDLPIFRASARPEGSLPRLTQLSVPSEERMNPHLVMGSQGLEAVLGMANTDFRDVHLDLIQQGGLLRIYDRLVLSTTRTLMRLDGHMHRTSTGDAEVQFDGYRAARPWPYVVGNWALVTLALGMIISLHYTCGMFFEAAGFAGADDDFWHRTLPTLLVGAAGVWTPMLMIDKLVKTDRLKTVWWAIVGSMAIITLIFWLICVAVTNGLVSAMALLPGRGVPPETAEMQNVMTALMVGLQIVSDCCSAIVIKSLIQKKLDARYGRRFIRDGAFADLRAFVYELRVEHAMAEAAREGIAVLAAHVAGGLQTHLNDTAAVFRARLWDLESRERAASEAVRRAACKRV